MTSSTETFISWARKVRKRELSRTPRHADDPLGRQARNTLQVIDHDIERVGDADDEGIGRVFLDARADLAHDLGVDADQVVAAHARFTRHAGRDDDDVGAGDRLVVVGAFHDRVETLDRAGLDEIERLALGNALGDVEQDGVAQLLQAHEVRQGAADLACADQRDFACVPW